MSYTLSTGCLRKAYGAVGSEMGDSDTSGQPVVQVLELKLIKNQTERFRLVLNDGEFYQQAMLASQLNELVKRDEVRPGTICKLNSFICQAMGAKRILIVLQLTAIGHGPAAAIGEPTNIEEHMDKIRAAATAGAPTSAAITPLPPSAIKPPVAGYLQKQQPTASTAFGPSSSIAPASSASSASVPLQFHPISSLNPYQNRWTIKARVTAKSDMRTWHNTRGEGKLFSVDLLDAQGGQIRATMFNDAVDKFFPLLAVDGVYSVSKGVLKPANKKFNLLPNDYELTLNADADIQFVEDDASIEQQRFNFQSIEQIGHKQENEFADVIGIVQSVQPLSHITSKATQKELTKRAVMLCDDTQLSIELTLWGEQAEKYNEGVLDSHPVLAIKNCKISNFGGKTLSTTFNSQIFLNPHDRPEAVRLQQWWAAQGGHTQFTALSQRMGGTGGGSINPTEARRALSDIKDEHLGNSLDEKGDTKADYLLVKATVTKLGHDFPKPPWYNACTKCNRKVTGSAGRVALRELRADVRAVRAALHTVAAGGRPVGRSVAARVQRPGGADSGRAGGGRQHAARGGRRGQLQQGVRRPAVHAVPHEAEGEGGDADGAEEAARHARRRAAHRLQDGEQAAAGGDRQDVSGQWRPLNCEGRTPALWNSCYCSPAVLRVTPVAAVLRESTVQLNAIQAAVQHQIMSTLPVRPEELTQCAVR